MKRIVVGYDGSEPAHRALEEAAMQYERSGVPLEVVTAWSFPIRSTPYPIGLDPHIFEQDAKHLLDGGVEWLAAHHATVQVKSRLVQDDPRNALLAAVSDEDWLVVGTEAAAGPPDSCSGRPRRAAFEPLRVRSWSSRRPIARR